MIQILALYLDFEGAKNIHVLEVLIWSFWGCWRFLSGVWHLDLIWIWSLVFDIPMVQIFALFLHFEGANNIHVLEVLIWSFARCWRFLNWVLPIKVDLDMVLGLWYTHDPKFCSLSWFWRCKEHTCPLSTKVGLWRILEVPYRNLASWPWFLYDCWSLIH